MERQLLIVLSVFILVIAVLMGSCSTEEEALIEMMEEEEIIVPVDREEIEEEIVESELKREDSCSGWDRGNYHEADQWHNVEFLDAPNFDCYKTTVTVIGEEKVEIYYPDTMTGHRGPPNDLDIDNNTANCFCPHAPVEKIAVVLFNGPNPQHICYNIKITEC